MTTRHSFLLLLGGILAGALLAVLFFKFANSSSSSDKVPKPLDDASPTAIKPSHRQKVTIGYPSRNMAGTCKIGGTIFSKDGAPVKGATVRLRLIDEPWPTANVNLEQVTDKTGQFQFTGLTGKARYQLFATALGLTTADNKNVLCGSFTDLTLEKGAVITLHLVTPGGHPAGGAILQLGGNVIWPPRQTVADEKGTVTIYGLAPGIYTAMSRTPTLIGRLNDPIQLAAGDRVEMELKLQPASTVEVRVTSQEQPVPHAAVTYADELTTLLPIMVATNRDGMARFGVVPNAVGTASILKQGFVPQTGISVRAGNRLSINLTAGGTITGVVQSKKGRLIPDAIVDVRPNAPKSNTDTTESQSLAFMFQRAAATLTGLPAMVPTGDAQRLAGPDQIPLPQLKNRTSLFGKSDSLGVFEINGVPRGEIQLTATHPTYVLWRPVTLQVTLGGRIDQVPLLMVPGVTAEVRVVSYAGQPVTNALVSVYRDTDAPPKEARTGKDGYVTLQGLAVEDQLMVSATQYLTARRRVIGTPGQTINLTVRLEPANQTLRGRVVNRLGVGVEHIAIQATLNRKGLYQTLDGTTDSDGRFALEGAGNGPYQVSATTQSGHRLALVQAAQPQTPINMVVDINANQLHDTPASPIPPVVNTASLALHSRLPAPSLNAPVTGGRPALIEPSDYIGDTLPSPTVRPGIGTLPIKWSKQNGRLVVKWVDPTSEVADAGLKPGQQLVKVDGRSIRTKGAAKKALTGRIGSVVMLEVIDHGAPLSIVVQRVAR